MLDGEMRFNSDVADGDEVKFGKVLVGLKGSTRAILSGERTALNFLGRMSGIASLTRDFGEAVSFASKV
jgi:nicotinate-nucleotide pyrophosphorylase (carboxylating)